MLLNNWRRGLRKLFYIIACLVCSLFFYSGQVLAGVEAVKIEVGDVETTQIIMTHHAKQRAKERGTNEEEIKQTIVYGEQLPAKQRRLKFIKTFAYNNIWNGRYFNNKKLEVVAVKEDESWIIITVITKFF